MKIPADEMVAEVDQIEIEPEGGLPMFEGEPEDPQFDQEVEQATRRLRVRDRAQRAYQEEQFESSELPDVVDLDEVLGLIPADPLIGELLYRNTLAQVSGPPGTFKSFIALGVACALAAGRNWGKHRVERSGHVLYVAAEGGAGIGIRVAAWCKHNGMSPSEIRPRFHIMTKPIQLGSDLHVDYLRSKIEKYQPDLVVVDTRARSTVGLEENSATDQGIAINNLEAIREDTGTCFLVVHHTGASGSQRGSTAWKGGVWSEITLNASGLNRDSNGKPLGATLTVEKHKDTEEPPPQSFDMEEIQVPQAWMRNVRSADQLTSLVAIPADEPHTSVESKASRTDRKSEDGERVREWLLAQHAETGRMPGRPATSEWASAQGIAFSAKTMGDIVRNTKAEVGL